MTAPSPPTASPNATNVTAAVRVLAALGTGLSLGVAVVVALGSNATVARGDEPKKPITVHLPQSGPPDAGAAAAAADAGPHLGFRFTKTPPDPTPLSSAHQWIFDLRYQEGDVFLTDTRAMALDAPRDTPRVMGRFALELFDHDVLIERVRFDFPFLGAPHTRDGGLETHVGTNIGVVFPQTPRGTRLELVDRAYGERWALPWPPKEQIYAPLDAGAARH